MGIGDANMGPACWKSATRASLSETIGQLVTYTLAILVDWGQKRKKRRRLYGHGQECVKWQWKSWWWLREEEEEDKQEEKREKRRESQSLKKKQKKTVNTQLCFHFFPSHCGNLKQASRKSIATP